ncbi:hypothetical protein C8R46DRAFT_1344494 [Mycena filopes]|nr:hypothetical protein C8R46DRAFT_1344494 [Mycena filopes]
MSLLSKLVNETYPLAIVQYERADFKAGSEEQLHWALMIVTKREKREGHIFQAVDRTYQGQSSATWTRSYLPKGSLLKTSKCLGLVQIGSVKARDLKAFIALVGDEDNTHGYPTVASFPGWTCKEWVLEVIELLRGDNAKWIDEGIVPPDRAATREMFYPALRRVAAATTRDRETVRNAPPVGEWLE